MLSVKTLRKLIPPLLLVLVLTPFLALLRSERGHRYPPWPSDPAKPAINLQPHPNITFVTLSLAKDRGAFAASVSSFCEFFDFSRLSLWLVVVPDVDVAAFEKSLPRCRIKQTTIPFKVINESHLIPEFASKSSKKPPRGYLKQMLLKLAVAKIVDGFYLALDSDVYAFSEFSVDDLFVMGKAKIDLEHPKYPDENWFRVSASVLGLSSLRQNTIEICKSITAESGWHLLSDESRLQKPVFVSSLEGTFAITEFQESSNTRTVIGSCMGDRDLNIGFTPMILHSSVITSLLIPRIIQLYGSLNPLATTSNWVQLLLDWHYANMDAFQRLYKIITGIDKHVSWTEYSLYFYSAVAGRVFDALYATTSTLKTNQKRIETGILDYDRSIMNWEDYRKADWNAMFAPIPADMPKRPFLIVHGWMKIPQREINGHLGTRILELAALMKDEEGIDVV